ncbi:MAG: hypothetical protein N2037_02575 [Acidimicrobiales bacterium]|nr:hypothetical protein [Acidimicrobiales bacterium]
MLKRKPVAVILALLALLVVLDACASSSRSRRARSVQGRGSPDPEEQSRYVGETLGFSPEESRCVVDRMRQAGIPISEVDSPSDQYFVPMLEIMRQCVLETSGSVPGTLGSVPPSGAGEVAPPESNPPPTPSMPNQ